MRTSWVYQKTVCFEVAFGVEFKGHKWVLHKTVVIWYSVSTMKTAIYTRVSKSDGSQDPENQLRELKAFCKKQGWDIVEVYTDFASGKRSDRASFKRMMLDASKRKFDTVLFWAMDRFSREGIEATLSYIRQLDAYKVGFRSYQEPFFDSAGPFKEFMISAFATFASLERARISERTLAGLAKAKAQGRVGGRPKLEDDPAMMKTFQELRKAKTSVRGIAAQMGISATTVQKLVSLESA
jgi:DNA invertase Pin-like site-specific DNA recombinase